MVDDYNTAGEDAAGSTVIPDSVYTNALASAGFSYSFWKVTERGSPQLSDLQPFTIVIWRTTDDLVNYGVDEDGKDEATALLPTATKEGKVKVVQLLLERGADINSRNANNQTPLGEAATLGNIDVVRLLIERSAEVDSCGRWGWTPLHIASEWGHLEVSRILVDHGANLNAREARHDA